MFDTDFTRFTAMLDEIAGVLPNAKPFTPAGKSLFFRALAKFRFEDVERGLMAHVADPQRGRFLPAPADVIAQIEGAAANDGRPGADEAWATALLARDENETVVWTTEIHQALKVTEPILAQGDKIGARMAFREAYDRIVAQARKERRPAVWQPSLGRDPWRREVALQQASRAGLLPAPFVAALLPAPDDAADGTDSTATDQNLAKLKALLASAVSPAGKRQAAREKEMKAESARLADLKLASAQRAGLQPKPLWSMASIHPGSTQ